MFVQNRFDETLRALGTSKPLGYGGFLDTPLRAVAFGHDHITNQNPGIVEPGNTIIEVIRENAKSEEDRFKKGKGFLKTIKKMQHDMKSHVLTPYVKVEALGWLFGFPLFGRTLFPATYNKLRKRFHDAIVPPVSTGWPSIGTMRKTLVSPTRNRRPQSSQWFGLWGSPPIRSSRLVAFVGHVSSSDNNPYESAIDCGACWGQSSAPNVRLFATMANRPNVRKYAAECGIEIPEDTHFIAALHNTTTDEITFFDPEEVPETHKSDLEIFKKGCREATARTAQERMSATARL